MTAYNEGNSYMGITQWPISFNPENDWDTACFYPHNAIHPLFYVEETKMNEFSLLFSS